MKEYLVTASQMKQYDKNTIEIHKMPSLLLMERAALVTVEALQCILGKEPKRVVVVSGCGNNGGDGLAVGRLLLLAGYSVEFVLVGDPSACSEETGRQLEILKSYGVSVFGRITEVEYDMDIVIDAIFGVGLSRSVTGVYAEAIDWINKRETYVCSIDIPSGIGADTGEVMGCAVQADLTVTYGFYKLGQMLYPGCGYCGSLICGQMGIDEKSFLGENPVWYTYLGIQKELLRKRVPDGNKGTFGKALVIAGSKQTCGAAMLAAKSVFRTGAGMVRVVTAVDNHDAVLQYVPEAMLLSYETDGDEINNDKTDCMTCEKATFWAAFEEAVSWADCILIGPGIGLGTMAKRLLRYCIEECVLPLVIDADGLNLLAEDFRLQSYIAERDSQTRDIILTPHLGEFGRLYGCEAAACKKHLTEYPLVLAQKLHCTVICKDARTVVAQAGAQTNYLNTTGNSGMATAGSGDVLAGMVTGLLAQGIKGSKAAEAGVYLHGLSGDMAAKAKTQEAMTATDIIEHIPAALKACQMSYEACSKNHEALEIGNDVVSDGGEYGRELSESLRFCRS